MCAGNAGARRFALCLGVLPLCAQELPYYERPVQQLTPAERDTVEFNRKLARSRVPSPKPALSAEEQARIRLFKRSRDSVVFIHAIDRTVVYQDKRGDQFTLPPASGTGFVWDNLGHVVTNHHVITKEEPIAGLPTGEADEFQVTLADGKSYKAVVIGRSLALDIAVLHVFAPLGAMKPLPIGSSSDLVVGQDLLAIGNPFNLDHTLTSGVVSGLGRDIKIPVFNTHITGAIQTDAAINPGNSGGPLLDRGGRLVGMNTAITSDSGSSSGVGFAIPVDTLNKVVPVLIAKGQNNRPVLGFTTLPAPEAANLGVARGIVVETVEPGGIAAAAGLQGIRVRAGAKEPLKREDYLLGDLIVGINGTKVEVDIQLMDLLELIPSEQPLAFEVLRNGKPLTLTLKPAEARSRKAPEQKT